MLIVCSLACGILHNLFSVTNSIHIPARCYYVVRFAILKEAQDVNSCVSDKMTSDKQTQRVYLSDAIF